MFNPKVSQAVAAAIALGAAAGAQAVTLGSVPPANILYISGSTAISPALIAYMVNSTDLVCNASLGAISTYTGTTSGGKFNAVACAAGSNIPGVTAGTSIAIIKENNAGSLNGINPIYLPTSKFVSYPAVSGIDADCTAGTTITPAGEQTQTPYTCTGYTIVSSSSGGPYSALGFADVEAGIFGVSPTGVGAMSSVDTPFGIAVSLGLYHALQGAENLPEDDAIADMPNMTRVQLAAIFNGQGGLSNWTHMYGAGTGSVGAQSVHFGNSGLSGGLHVCYDGTADSTATDCQSGTQSTNAVAPANTNIYFCERGQSSGTQNTTQIFFGNLGCAGEMLSFQSPSKPGATCSASGCSWSSAYNGSLVFAGNGQPDDLECLEAHDQLGEFAVSLSSTDQEWGQVAVTAGNTATADWRFIRVDGYAPSNENIAAGKYDLWAQSAGYYAESGVNYPSGVELSLLNFFTNASTKLGGGTAAAIDAALQRSNPTLDGGILAIPGGGSVPNASSASLATFRSNPVNGFLRQTAANNCQPPYLAPNAPDISNTPTWDPTSIQ